MRKEFDESFAKNIRLKLNFIFINIGNCKNFSKIHQNNFLQNILQLQEDIQHPIHTRVQSFRVLNIFAKVYEPKKYFPANEIKTHIYYLYMHI